MKGSMKIKLRELFRIISITALAGLIGACAGYESRYAKKIPVKPGDDIQINITADIPLNRARVYSQNGQLITKSDIDKNDVYCSVLMHKLQLEDGMKLSISPGRFRVTQVRFSNDLSHAPRIFASREWFFDPPSNVNYQTELRLASASQPEVRSLICVRQIDGYGNHYPGPSDFKKGLGSLVEFNQDMQ